MEAAPQTEDPFFAPYGEKFWDDYQLDRQRNASHSLGRLFYDLCDYPQSVLDVGCGPGQILSASRRRVRRFLGD